jgi:osmoprotectant transport system ATP-binding protein
MNTQQPVLELSGLAKTFGDVVAVHPTSLRIDRGHTKVLIGPSGCGKSTLVRMILGLIKPDRGSVSVQQVPLSTSTRIAFRRMIGYVVQNGGLFPHLTAGQNVGLLASRIGWGAEKTNDRMRRLFELVRLPWSLSTRYPSELSGGQQQRLGLVRALMLDPPLLILDEPLGALDPLVRGELQNDLRMIFRQLEKSVLMITHDLYEASFFADSLALMHEGEFLQTGTMDDLIHRPASEFVTRFVESQQRVLVLDR